jgi:hypothetical protein
VNGHSAIDWVSDEEKQATDFFHQTIPADFFDGSEQRQENAFRVV